MRIVGEVSHPSFKITIFSWNNRYLLKFEQGYYEQTYKIDQFELANESDLYKIINDDFIQSVTHHFESMAQSLNKALQSV
jgi:hypothetical protein